jgi:hypothetical protein
MFVQRKQTKKKNSDYLGTVVWVTAGGTKSGIVTCLLDSVIDFMIEVKLECRIANLEAK